jgi:hypothetical protein
MHKIFATASALVIGTAVRGATAANPAAPPPSGAPTPAMLVADHADDGSGPLRQPT